MADKLSPEQRRNCMMRVKGKHTKPEKAVRSLLHRYGFRFRLHRKDLPGNPDIVLPKYNTVIFVHGCFWHQHPGCKKATFPVNNAEFWRTKLQRNLERDRQAQEELRESGWRIVTVWECELNVRNHADLVERLAWVLRGADAEN